MCVGVLFHLFRTKDSFTLLLQPVYVCEAIAPMFENQSCCAVSRVTLMSLITLFLIIIIIIIIIHSMLRLSKI